VSGGRRAGRRELRRRQTQETRSSSLGNEAKRAEGGGAGEAAGVEAESGEGCVSWMKSAISTESRRAKMWRGGDDDGADGARVMGENSAARGAKT
jgi:hypothetical protein